MHFLYSDIWKNIFTSIIAPINESVWEHMKLAYIPLIIFSIFEYSVLKIKPFSKFVSTKVIEMYIIIFVTAISFYTYSGILGFNFLAADISTFILAVIVGQIYSYKSLNNKTAKYNYKFAILLLILLIFSFTLFTFWQPNLALFKVN